MTKNIMMMKKFSLLMLAGLLAMRAIAQTSPVFPKGEISNTNNHTGTIWLNELSKPDSILNYSVALATYTAGSKLDWHVHPAGQILLITEGTGYYQEKGKPVQVVRKGDVIKCAPGIPHWHGAAPNSSFAYIAFTPAQNGKTIWLQRVTDQEYNSLKNQD